MHEAALALEADGGRLDAAVVKEHLLFIFSDFIFIISF